MGLPRERHFGLIFQLCAAAILDFGRRNHLDQCAALRRQRNRHCAGVPKFTGETAPGRHGYWYGSRAGYAAWLCEYRLIVDAVALYQDRRRRSTAMDRSWSKARVRTRPSRTRSSDFSARCWGLRGSCLAAACCGRGGTNWSSPFSRMRQLAAAY